MRIDYALVAALYAIALAFRLVPLAFSPLPFSVDGFSLGKIAEQITQSGGWRLDFADVNAYNARMPVFSLLWSAFEQLASVPPLTSLAWSVPILTSTVVLPAYLLGLKVTGHRGVGFVSGLFLSVFGSFLSLTTGVAKESVGLVILPVAVLLFHERADPRKRAMAFVLLLILPFLHHLTTLVLLGVVTSNVVLTQRRALARGTFTLRAFLLDVLSGPLTAVPAWAYYSAVDMPFFREVTSGDEIVLFLAIVVLLTALLARLWRPAPRRLGKSLARPSGRLVVFPVVVFGVVLLNAGTGMFAGAVGTQPAFLELVPAILVMAVFAVLGFQVLRRTSNRGSDLVVSMLVAPTALVLFGLLRGLDFLSFVIVYRAFDFMDYAIALLVGVGFVLAWNRLRPHRAAAVALAAVFAAALLATTPMAWNSEAVFGVENVTTPAEFQALGLLASLGAKNVTTDERLADVGAWWFGYHTDPTLPIRLQKNETIEGTDYALVLEQWTTIGAQIHPAPNVVVSRTVLESFLQVHRVVYSAGDSGNRIYVVQLG